MFEALKPGFRRLATLKLVVNVVGELQTRKEQLRGMARFGMARFPCDSTAFLSISLIVDKMLLILV